MGKGPWEGLKKSVEGKNKTSEELKSENSKEAKSKRSYALQLSTISKLDELKVYYYKPGTRLEKIVDEAICLLYEQKKN